jgi:hypothetical protein
MYIILVCNDVAEFDEVAKPHPGAVLMRLQENTPAVHSFTCTAKKTADAASRFLTAHGYNVLVLQDEPEWDDVK